MSGREVIAIDDDEDEELEVVFADVPPPSKLNQLRLQIDLLQAFCDSSEPIPMEYHKFYKFAKKVRPNVSNAIILAAWKRAIAKQLNCMVKRKTHPLGRVTSNISSIVDLTDPIDSASSSSSSSEPLHGSETEHTSPPMAIPVALIANPNYQQNIDLPTEPLTTCNDTSLIDVTLVNELENVTNCLVKIINDSVQSSEGFNNRLISEEEISCNSSTSEMYSSQNWTKLNTPSDSETSSLCHAFDWEVINDGNEQSIERDDSNQSIKKQRKRKSKDERNILLEFPTAKFSQLVSSSFEQVPPATTSKSSSTRKKRKTNKSISISEAELKLFREEQKRQKLREKRDLMSMQLERVHERLVDVLIPKYFKDSFKDN